MYKIIHIHNDTKFIDETSIFENPEFDNEVVILGEKGSYFGKYQESSVYLRSSKRNIKWLVDHCKEADIVVLYNLCLMKSIIANLLDDDIKVIWRFFGYELYRSIKDTFYSELTKEKLKPNRHSLRIVLRNQLKQFFQFRDFIKLRTTYNLEFFQALDRVDLFLGHYGEEYEYLKENWPDLPPFVNLPALANFRKLKKLQEKDNGIILGNSRNPLNNHFDILNIFLSSKNIKKFNMIIPFSYYNETHYSMGVREIAKLYSNILLLEDFITIEDYEAIFKKASVFISNSLRQAALGNILLALQNGVKIYLNQKNVIYSALISQGLLVFSVDQFRLDLENNDIRLSGEEMKHNVFTMRKLAKENSISSFQDRIMNALLL